VYRRSLVLYVQANNRGGWLAGMHNL